MHADTAATTELQTLNLPKELLTEVKRNGARAQTDFGVEGMTKPSLLDRFVEKLLGGKRGR